MIGGDGDISGGVNLARGDLNEGGVDAADAGQAQVTVLLGSFHTVWATASDAGVRGDVDQV